jgi:light-regulated signal transduction histidine kinase (bacteriophytochrome)
MDELVRAQDIADSLREPLLVLGPDLRVKIANLGFCERFALQREEAIERDVEALGDGFRVPGLREFLEAILGERAELDTLMVDHEFARVGRRVLSIRARKTVHGELVLSFEDLTVHARLSRELEEIERDLEAFTYSVSHDLRAPLRAIDGFSRILVEDHGDALDPAAKKTLAVIRRNTSAMSLMIDELMALAALGRRPLQKSEVDMEELARAALSEAESAETVPREIRAHIGSLPRANGDRALLAQVWLRLLSNAVKYTRPRVPAILEIEGAAQGSELVYSVKDNGVGFEMEYAEKLFGVFQRLHANTPFEGAGIGLAFVQRIVRRHRGRVWAVGAPDRGATFYFALPA